MKQTLRLKKPLGAKSSISNLPTKKSIKSRGPKDEVMLFYGPPGVGKTTFVNDMDDNVLFMSTDRGTRHLKTMAIECSTWLDFLKVLELLESKDSPKYNIIAVDHVDDWANAAEDYVCKKLGIDSLGDAGFAKGWRAFKKELLTFLGRLKALDTGIVFIAHETIKTVKTRIIETDRTMPDMGKSAWKVIVPLVSVAGYCGFSRAKKNGKPIEIRTLVTQPSEAVYAKDRTRRNRPDGLERLDGKAFYNTFQTQTNKG